MSIEAMKQILHSTKQARIHGNDWRRELELIENISSQAIEQAQKQIQPSAYSNTHQQEPVACIGYWNQKTGAFYKPDQIAESHRKLIEDGILRRCYTSPSISINDTSQERVDETVKQRHEQEPVAWLITDRNINSIQIESIRRLIDRARHAHMADLKLRINGEDEWYEVDWLKHLIRAIPPQRPAAEGEDTRKWVGLTDEQIGAIATESQWGFSPHDDTLRFARAIEAAHGIKE